MASPFLSPAREERWRGGLDFDSVGLSRSYKDVLTGDLPEEGLVARLPDRTL
jgi:hypothetical protein